MDAMFLQEHISTAVTKAGTFVPLVTAYASEQRMEAEYVYKYMHLS
jgi:hypothetical protein